MCLATSKMVHPKVSYPTTNILSEQDGKDGARVMHKDWGTAQLLLEVFYSEIMEQ